MKTGLNALEIPAILLALNDASVINRLVAKEVDARGLMCPLPLLKARQGLREINESELLRVVATDAGSVKDFISFAQITGQVLEGFFSQQGEYFYLIRKK